MFLYKDQLTLFESNDDLNSRVYGYKKKDFEVKYLDRIEANEIIRRNHYSHKVVMASTDHFGVYIDGVLVGVLQYGHALNPKSISNIIPDSTFDNFRELNRMWLSDEAPKYSESRAISYSIKILKKKYKDLKWIQSFADERCGKLGVVYQASNFRYYGKHLTQFYEYNGEVLHKLMLTSPKHMEITRKRFKVDIQKILEDANKMSLWQFRYIYFLDQRIVSQCLLKQEPYPKPSTFYQQK